jgi:hypothetical protein
MMYNHFINTTVIWLNLIDAMIYIGLIKMLQKARNVFLSLMRQLKIL